MDTSLVPHLESPAHLMRADTNDAYSVPPHLKYLNYELIEFWLRGRRLMGNAPPQHAKSTLFSTYFPAWVLLLWPKTRVLVLCYNKEQANDFGEEVRRIVGMWGEELGVKVSTATKAKSYWKVDRHGGSMRCLGVEGGVTGKAADLILVDDMVKNPEEALSPVQMEKVWNLYSNVAISRLRNETKIAINMTRWSRRDLCGRILDLARETGEEWRVVKFKAIAEQDDILGRRPGEPLWPQNASLELLMEKKAYSPRFWKPNYQQEPEDQEGAFFAPSRWPTYEQQGGVYYVQEAGGKRLFHRGDLTIMVTVDWATSERKKSDYTAAGVFALTCDGRLFILEAVQQHVAIDTGGLGVGPVLFLARVCRKWRPDFAAVESGGFQTSLAQECRKYPEIPEPRRVTHRNRTKLQRALTAINWSDNGRIYLPAARPEWVHPYEAQLESFTGEGDAHDDFVDITSIAATQAQAIGPSEGTWFESECIIGGKEFLS